MTTVRHVAHAVGSTGSTVPAYRVNLRVGPHELVADEPTAAGGGAVGPSPFGLLISGLAACTATTLRMYAARKGWDLTTIDVDVRYDIADDGRGAIKRTITVPVDLPPDHRKRLADLAERTPRDPGHTSRHAHHHDSRARQIGVTTSKEAHDEHRAVRHPGRSPRS